MIQAGSAVSVYMEEQILKISLLGANHGGAFMYLMCVPNCPTKLSDVTVCTQVKVMWKKKLAKSLYPLCDIILYHQSFQNFSEVLPCYIFVLEAYHFI